MFIPIRRGLKTSQILIAFVCGVGASIYAWTPIIREDIQKKKKSQAANEPEPEPEQKA